MLTIQRSGISLEFNEETAVICSLRYGTKEYIGEEVPVFKIALRDTEGELGFLEMNDMQFVDCKQEGNCFEAIYGAEHITVRVSAEILDCIAWGISIHLEDSRVLEWVNFPQIAVPNDLKDHGGKSKILWGYNEGGLVDDLAHKENSCFYYREPQYPSVSCIPIYPGIVETQFVAYYNEESGLYFGAHDKENHLKGIDFYPYGNGIMLQFRHFCGLYYGESYNMTFPMVMQFFKGEWQDAAEIYRTWFEKNKAEDFVTICENPCLPEWYSQSPVIITYPVRGRHDGDVMEPNKLFPYCNAMEHVERLEKELNSKIMVILMHWEGTAPWAPPYVWPPYGGEEELRKFIDALHERGDVFGVYCSGMGWTQFSKLVENYNKEAEFEEKNLKEVMCLSPQQDLPYCNIVPAIRAGYDMCPSQKFTTDVLKREVEHMVAAGIDYIQLLDQNHGGTSYFCYSRNHGHPPVPGKWQVDAVQNLLKEIKKSTNKVLLGCESAAAESYIPYLLFSDNRFELNYAMGRPVPVYAYLYHEYVNNFMGNQVCANDWLDHKRSPVNLLERMAYSFAAGDMLTLVLNENGNISWNWGWRELDDIPNQENIIEFTKNANRWRRGMGKKYLHTGRMVKPIHIECGENVLYSPEGYELLVEKIHTSAWEAEDRAYGQFLINYNPEDVVCRISLPEGIYKLYEDENTFSMVEGEVTLSIKKLSVILLERA